MKKFIAKLSGPKIALIVVIALMLGLILLIFFILPKKISFFSKKGANLEDQTIIGLIQADTDKDGILDWEEVLWGTDKENPATFDDIPDAKYIEEKKTKLGIADLPNNTRLTETEKFAREFFSAYTALEAGEVENVTTASFANALGQRVVNPNLVDKYKAEEVIITAEDTIYAQEKYYATIKGFFEEAQEIGAGNELDIVSEAVLKNNTTGQLVELKDLELISQAYQDFSGKVMETSVPQSLQDLHLQIANSANNTSIAITNMAKIITDPVVGLSGLSQYQKYGDDLVNAVSDLETSIF